MTKDEVKKLRMNSPESLQFLNNATKFYNLMMMYMMLHGGERVKAENLSAILDWYRAQQ